MPAAHHRTTGRRAVRLLIPGALLVSVLALAALAASILLGRSHTDVAPARPAGSATGLALNTEPMRWLPGRSPDGRGYMIGLGAGRRIAFVDLPRDGRSFIAMEYGGRCDPRKAGPVRAYLLRPAPRPADGHRSVATLASPRLGWLDDALTEACTLSRDLLPSLPLLDDRAAMAMLSAQIRIDRDERLRAKPDRRAASGVGRPF